MSVTYDPKLTQIPEYIIWYFQEHGELLTNLKLQKILYYAQGWHLALYNKPIFPATFEAWIHGPVLPYAYHNYKKYKYGPITEKATKPPLPKKLCDHLNEIIEVYGSYSAFELENLTHSTDPWLKARGSIPIDESSKAEIDQEEMKRYFKNKRDENAQKENSR